MAARHRRGYPRTGLRPVADMPVGGHAPGSLLGLISLWLSDMRVRHYAPTSVIFYEAVLGLFAAWLAERDVTQAAAVTRPMIEAYQRHLARQRGKTGQFLAVNTQWTFALPEPRHAARASASSMRSRISGLTGP